MHNGVIIVTLALCACTSVRVLSASSSGGEIVIAGPEQNVEADEYMKSRCPVNGYTVVADEQVFVRTDPQVRTMIVGGQRVRQVVDVPVYERHVRFDCAAPYTAPSSS
jgi:hypothetical protein